MRGPYESPEPLFLGENRVNFLQQTPEAFINGNLCGIDDISS
jgi:hypothetical protein